MKNLVINIIFILPNLFQKLYNFFWIKYKDIDYQTFPVIKGKIYLKGNGKIVFGRSVKINSGKNANPIGGDVKTILAVSKNGIIKIGDFSGISNAALICQEEISIGKNVKIGGGVKIYDTDFHSLNFKERKHSEKDIPITSPVNISDSCFIGAHTIVLKGVSIGENTIIGAGSVVAKSIPSNEIWAGNPVKFIKKL